MNSNKLWMTAQTPSRFVMPISGHAFGATSRATGACMTATVVRDRITGTTGAVKAAGKGLAPSRFPGTTAWRPPTC